MEEIKKKLVDIFKLEERVLYDAAGAADIVAAAEAEAQAQQEAADRAAEEARQAAEEAAKNAPPEDPAAKNEAEAGVAADIEAADNGIDADSLADGEFADVDDMGEADDIAADTVVDDLRGDDNDDTLYAEAFTPEAEEVRELVVINSSVKDAQKIIDSLGDNTDVLILENGKDGLDQINDYLDENSDVKYSALHIVSHGNAGYFTLCGEVIDGEAVANDPASWANIGEHLTEDGDIMLYACNLAGNEQGQLLVSQIASLTNADVAASVDTTGVHGNWDLEYSIGAVKNEFISPADYNHRLDVLNITVGNVDNAEQNQYLSWSDMYTAIKDKTAEGEFLIRIDKDVTATTDMVDFNFTVTSNNNNTLTIEAAEAAADAVDPDTAIDGDIIATGNIKVNFSGIGEASTGTLTVTPGNGNLYSGAGTVTYSAGSHVLAGTYRDIKFTEAGVINSDVVINGAVSVTTLAGNNVALSGNGSVEFGNQASYGNITEVNGLSVTYNSNSILAGTYNNLTLSSGEINEDITVTGTLSLANSGALSGEGSLVFASGAVYDAVNIAGVDGFSVTYNGQEDVLTGDYVTLTLNAAASDYVIDWANTTTAYLAGNADITVNAANVDHISYFYMSGGTVTYDGIEAIINGTYYNLESDGDSVAGGVTIINNWNIETDESVIVTGSVRLAEGANLDVDGTLTVLGSFSVFGNDAISGTGTVNVGYIFTGDGVTSVFNMDEGSTVNFGADVDIVSGSYYNVTLDKAEINSDVRVSGDISLNAANMVSGTGSLYLYEGATLTNINGFSDAADVDVTYNGQNVLSGHYGTLTLNRTETVEAYTIDWNGVGADVVAGNVDITVTDAVADTVGAFNMTGGTVYYTGGNVIGGTYNDLETADNTIVSNITIRGTWNIDSGEGVTISGVPRLDTEGNPVSDEDGNPVYEYATVTLANGSTLNLNGTLTVNANNQISGSGDVKIHYDGGRIVVGDGVTSVFNMTGGTVSYAVGFDFTSYLMDYFMDNYLGQLALGDLELDSLDITANQLGNITVYSGTYNSIYLPELMSAETVTLDGDVAVKKWSVLGKTDLTINNIVKEVSYSGINRTITVDTLTVSFGIGGINSADNDGDGNGDFAITNVNNGRLVIAVLEEGSQITINGGYNAVVNTSHDFDFDAALVNKGTVTVAAMTGDASGNRVAVSGVITDASGTIRFADVTNTGSIGIQGNALMMQMLDAEGWTNEGNFVYSTGLENFGFTATTDAEGNVTGFNDGEGNSGNAIFIRNRGEIVIANPDTDPNADPLEYEFRHYGKNATSLAVGGINVSNYNDNGEIVGYVKSGEVDNNSLTPGGKVSFTAKYGQDGVALKAAEIEHFKANTLTGYLREGVTVEQAGTFEFYFTGDIDGGIFVNHRDAVVNVILESAIFNSSVGTGAYGGKLNITVKENINGVASAFQTDVSTALGWYENNNYQTALDAATGKFDNSISTDYDSADSKNGSYSVSDRFYGCQDYHAFEDGFYQGSITIKTEDGGSLGLNGQVVASNKFTITENAGSVIFGNSGHVAVVAGDFIINGGKVTFAGDVDVTALFNSGETTNFVIRDGSVVEFSKTLNNYVSKWNGGVKTISSAISWIASDGSIKHANAYVGYGDWTGYIYTNKDATEYYADYGLYINSTQRESTSNVLFESGSTVTFNVDGGKINNNAAYGYANIKIEEGAKATLPSINNFGEKASYDGWIASWNGSASLPKEYFCEWYDGTAINAGAYSVDGIGRVGVDGGEESIIYGNTSARPTVGEARFWINGGVTVSGIVVNEHVNNSQSYWTHTASFMVTGRNNNFKNALVYNGSTMQLGWDEDNPLDNSFFGTIYNGRSDDSSWGASFLSIKGNGNQGDGNDFGVVINEAGNADNEGVRISNTGRSSITLVNHSGRVNIDGFSNDGLAFLDRADEFSGEIYSGITMLGGEIVLASNLQKAIDSSITIKGGTFHVEALNTFNGKITVQNGGQFDINAKGSTFGGLITNYGLFSINEYTNFKDDVTIKNEAGGILGVKAADIVIYNVTNKGTLTVGKQITLVNMTNEAGAKLEMTASSAEVPGADGTTFVNLVNNGNISLPIKDLLFTGGLTNNGVLTFVGDGGYRFANMINSKGEVIFVNAAGATINFSSRSADGTYVDLRNFGTVKVGTEVCFGRVINEVDSRFEVNTSGAAHFFGHLTHNGTFTGARTININGFADGYGKFDMLDGSTVNYSFGLPVIDSNGYWRINGTIVGDAYPDSENGRPVYSKELNSWVWLDDHGNPTPIDVFDGISEYADVRAIVRVDANGNPVVGANGDYIREWWIGNFNTGISCGTAAPAPVIDAETGYWMFNGISTGIQGQAMAAGDYALTQHIYGGKVSNLSLQGGVDNKVNRVTLENTHVTVENDFSNTGSQLQIVGKSTLHLKGDRYADDTDAKLTVVSGGKLEIEKSSTINSQLNLRGEMEFKGVALTITNSTNEDANGIINATKVIYNGNSNQVYAGTYNSLVLGDEGGTSDEMTARGNLNVKFFTNNLTGAGMRVVGSVVSISGAAGGNGDYIVSNGGELKFNTLASLGDGYTINGTITAAESASKVSFTGSEEKRIHVMDFINNTSKTVIASYTDFDAVENNGKFTVNDSTVTLGHFENNGELVFDLGQADRFSVDDDSIVTSSGTITLNSGTLDLRYSGTDDVNPHTYGTVNINNNAELKVTGNYVQINALTVEADASVITSGTGIVFGAADTNDGVFTLNGSLRVDGGHLTINGYATDGGAKIAVAKGELTLAPGYDALAVEDTVIEVYGNVTGMFHDNGRYSIAAVDEWVLIENIAAAKLSAYDTETTKKFIIRDTDSTDGVTATLILNRNIEGMSFRVEGEAKIIVGENGTGTASEIYLYDGGSIVNDNTLSVSNLTALGTITGSGNLTVNDKLIVSVTDENGVTTSGSIEMTGGTVTYGDSITDILAGTYFNLTLGSGEYSVANIELLATLTGAGTLTINGNSRGTGEVTRYTYTDENGEEQSVYLNVAYKYTGTGDKVIYGGTYGDLIINDKHTLTENVTVNGKLDITGGNAGNVVIITVAEGKTLETRGDLLVNGDNANIAFAEIRADDASVKFYNEKGNDRLIFSGTYRDLFISGDGNQSIGSLKLNGTLSGDGSLIITQSTDGSGSVIGYTYTDADDVEQTEYLDVRYANNYTTKTILRGTYGDLMLEATDDRIWNFEEAVTVEGAATINGIVHGTAGSSIEFKGATSGRAVFGSKDAAFAGTVTYSNDNDSVQHIFGGNYENLVLNSSVALIGQASGGVAHGVIANNVSAGAGNSEIRFVGESSEFKDITLNGSSVLRINSGSVALTNIWDANGNAITSTADVSIVNLANLTFNSSFTLTEDFENKGKVAIAGVGNKLTIESAGERTFGKTSIFVVGENATLDIAGGMELNIAEIENKGTVTIDSSVLKMKSLNGDSAGARFSLTNATVTLDGGSYYRGNLSIDGRSTFAVEGSNTSTFEGAVDNQGRFVVGDEYGNSPATVNLYTVSAGTDALFEVYDYAKLYFRGNNDFDQYIHGTVINTKYGSVYFDSSVRYANYYNYWIEVSNSIKTGGEGNFLEVLDKRFGYIFSDDGATITVVEGSETINSDIIIRDGITVVINGDETASGGTVSGVTFAADVINHGTLTASNAIETVTFKAGTYVTPVYSNVDRSNTAGTVSFENASVVYENNVTLVFGGDYGNLTLRGDSMSRDIANVTVDGVFRLDGGSATVTDGSTFNGRIDGTGYLYFTGNAQGSATVGDVENQRKTDLWIFYQAQSGESQHVFGGLYQRLYFNGTQKNIDSNTTVYGYLDNSARGAVIGSDAMLTLADKSDALLGKIDIKGTLNIEGSISAGDMIVSDTGTLQINNSNVTFKTLENRGTVEFKKDYEFREGVLANYGTLNISKDITVTLRDGIYSGSITNSGTLNLNDAGVFNSLLNNANAVLNVNAKNSFGAGFVNKGTMNIAAGADVSFTGVDYSEETALTSGTVINRGSLTIGTAGMKFDALVNASDAVLNVNANHTFGAEIESAGTINIGAGYEVTIEEGNYENGYIVNAGILNLNYVVSDSTSLKNKVGGKLFVNEDYTFGETVENQGNMYVGEDVAVVITGGTYSKGVIENYGTLALAYSTNYGELTNYGSLAVVADNSFGGKNQTELWNGGDMYISQGVTVTLNENVAYGFFEGEDVYSSTINNAGTLVVNTPGFYSYGSFVNSGDLTFNVVPVADGNGNSWVGFIDSLTNSGTVTINGTGSKKISENNTWYDAFYIAELVNYQNEDGEVTYGTLSVEGSKILLMLNVVDTGSVDSKSVISVNSGNQLGFALEDGTQTIYGTVTADLESIFFETKTLEVEENRTFIKNFVIDGWIIINEVKDPITVAAGNKYWIVDGGELTVEGGASTQFKVDEGGKLTFAKDYTWNVEAEVSDLLGGTVEIAEGVKLTINVDTGADEYFVIDSTLTNNGTLDIVQGGILLTAVNGTGAISGTGNIYFTQSINGSQSITMTGGTVIFGGSPKKDENGNIIAWEDTVDVLNGTYHNVMFFGQKVKDIDFTFTGKISGYADIVIDGTNVKYEGNNASVEMYGGTVTYTAKFADGGVLTGLYNNLTLGENADEVEKWTISKDIFVIDTLDAKGVDRNLVFEGIVNRMDAEEANTYYYSSIARIINTPNVVTYADEASGSELLAGEYKYLSLEGREYNFSGSNLVDKDYGLSVADTLTMGVHTVLSIKTDKNGEIAPVVNINGKIKDDATSGINVGERATLNLNYMNHGGNLSDNQVKGSIIATDGGIINIDGTYGSYIGVVGTGVGDGSQLNITGTGNSFSFISNAVGWYQAGVYNTGNLGAGSAIGSYGGKITIDLGADGTISFNEEFVAVNDVYITSAKTVNFSDVSVLGVYGGKFEVSENVKFIQFNTVDIAYVFNSERDTKFIDYAVESKFNGKLHVFTVEPHASDDWVYDTTGNKERINEKVSPMGKLTEVRIAKTDSENDVRQNANFAGEVLIDPTMNKVLFAVDGNVHFKETVTNKSGSYSWSKGGDGKTNVYGAHASEVYFYGNSNGKYDKDVTNSGEYTEMRFGDNNLFKTELVNTDKGRLYVDGDFNEINTLVNNYSMILDGNNRAYDIRNTGRLDVLNATGGILGISANSGTINIAKNCDDVNIIKLDNGTGGGININANLTINVEVNNSGTISVDGNVTFKKNINNAEGAVFAIKGSSGSSLDEEAKIYNNGEFSIDSSCVNFAGDFINSGKLSISGTEFYLEEVINYGNITVSAINSPDNADNSVNRINNLRMESGSSLDIADEGYLVLNTYRDTATASITVADKATLVFLGNSYVRADVTVKGDGEVRGSASFANITYTDWVIITSNATLNGNTLTYTAGNKEVEVSASGRFRIADGATLTVEDAGVNVRFKVDNGTLNLNDANQTFANEISVGSAGTLNINAAGVKFTYDNPWYGGYGVINYGTINVNNTGITFTGVLNEGTITVDAGAGAGFGNLVNAGMVAVAGTLTGSVDNKGTVSVAKTGTLTVSNKNYKLDGKVHGEGGNIGAANGSLELTGTTTGTANFTSAITYSNESAMAGTYTDLSVKGEVAFGGNVEVSGTFSIIENGNAVLSGGVTAENLSGGARANINVSEGGSLSVGNAKYWGSISNSGDLTVTAGNVETMTIEAGVANVSGTVANMTVNGGEANVSGAVTDMTVAAGAVVNMNGNGEVTESITVKGTVNIKSTTADINAETMDFSEGTLVFASGAEAHSYDIKADIGTLKVTNGTNLTVNVSSAVSVTNTDLAENTVLTFKGEAGSLTAANVTVAEGATLSSQVAGSLRNDNTSYSRGMAITGEINNSGTIEVNGEGNVLGIQTDELANTGKIQAVNNGTLLLLSQNGTAHVGGTVVQDDSRIYSIGEITFENLEYWFTIDENSSVNNADSNLHTLKAWLNNEGKTAGVNEKAIKDEDLSNVTFRVQDVNFYVNDASGNAADYSLETNAGLTFTLEEYTADAGGNVSSSGTGTKVTVNENAEVKLNSVSVDTVNNAGTLTVEDVTLKTYTDTSSAELEVSGKFTVAAGGSGVKSEGTVTYNGTKDQTIANGSYTELTLAGSGEKTLAENGAISVSGELSVEGSASLNAAAGKVTYNGGDQDIAEGTYGDLALEGTGIKTATGDFTVSGDLTVGGSAAMDADEGNFTFNGEDQSIVAGDYNSITLVNGVKNMESGGVYNVGSFTAENTTVTSSGEAWTLNATGSVKASETHIDNAINSKPIKLEGANIVTNSTGWQFFDAYGAVGDSAPGVDNKNFQALASQLGEQLRGEELTVLYEDGDILFRSNRVRSTGSVDELRNAIEDFGHEIDIEHFGVGFHGFDLDEEFDELDVADALASEMDAALKEIVEHE